MAQRGDLRRARARAHARASTNAAHPRPSAPCTHSHRRAAPGRADERLSCLRPTAVVVSWNRGTYPVEIDLDEPPAVFKSQVFSLTGVPVDRQKIMVKGGMLKDEWGKVKLKEGQKLMMMGSAEAIPVAPEKAITFVEDLPEEEQEAAMMPKDYGAGLVNLGNTCYMAATMQCLANVPELGDALNAYDSGSGIEADASHKLVLATRDLIKEMRTSRQAVVPFKFLTTLRQRFPQFNEQGQGGVYSQQDAEECWTGLVNALDMRINAAGGDEKARSSVRDLFSIGYESTLTCAESGETSKEESSDFMFKCNVTQSVNHLNLAMQECLNGTVEKNSEQLGRSAVWTKETKLSKLPRYFPVETVRFYYKVETQTKCKIMKAVTFPLTLDVYDQCTPELKKQLDVGRRAEREAADAVAARKRALNGATDAAGGAAGGSDVPTEAANKDTDGDSAMADEGDVPAPEVGKPLPTGKYDLVAVLTHKGRSADGGHYIGWTKQKDGQWLRFDDDDVEPQKEEDILKLNGGALRARCAAWHAHLFHARCAISLACARWSQICAGVVEDTNADGGRRASPRSVSLCRRARYQAATGTWATSSCTQSARSRRALLPLLERRVRAPPRRWSRELPASLPPTRPIRPPLKPQVCVGAKQRTRAHARVKDWTARRPSADILLDAAQPITVAHGVIYVPPAQRVVCARIARELHGHSCDAHGACRLIARVNVVGGLAGGRVRE